MNVSIAAWLRSFVGSSIARGDLWMHYHMGLTKKAAKWAVRKQKLHRRVGHWSDQCWTVRNDNSLAGTGLTDDSKI